MVHSNQPFAGPKAVLAYLARYTHSVAISDHRLNTVDATYVAFEYEDYRADDLRVKKSCRLSPTSSLDAFSFTCPRPASIAFAIA